MAIRSRGLIPSYVVDTEVERLSLINKPDFTLCYVRATKISYNYDALTALWVAVPTATVGLSINKPSDQSIANSIVLTDDNALKFLMLAGESYRFDIILFIKNATAIPDIQFQITSVTTPADIRYQVETWPDNMVGQMIDHLLFESINQVVTVSWNSIPNTYCRLQGTVTAGNANSLFRIQWAQRVSSATPTVVKRGSSMNIVKLVPVI